MVNQAFIIIIAYRPRRRRRRRRRIPGIGRYPMGPTKTKHNTCKLPPFKVMRGIFVAGKDISINIY